MKKSFIFFSIVVFLLAGALLFTLSNFSKDDKIIINGKEIHVEIARTLEEKQKGLMFRESLGLDEGMLFVYESEGNYRFWMKNTLIPLKIIWISEEGEVVHIEDAVPCVEKYDSDCEIYSSSILAKYILEISPETFGEVGIKLGDEVKFNFL